MAHEVKTEHCYVHKDLSICGGDPVIVGARIPVRLVYQRTQAGDTVEMIQQAYPHLTPAQIHDDSPITENPPEAIDTERQTSWCSSESKVKFSG